MLAKTVEGVTTAFSYDSTVWQDRLTAVNGVALTYDANGNVLTYGDREYTWNTGRNLAQITDGDNTYSYTYDENGIRTSKTVNGVTTYFNTKDGVILSQTDGTNTMYFQYDTSGTPLGFIYNGTQYFYMTNQMGDVIAINDCNGNILAQYIYDEWGKVIAQIAVNEDDEEAIALVNANPIRYRGYYLDSETGYYYLQSRYYDPTICRFINADLPKYTQLQKDDYSGTNLFAYCCNEPVNNVDYSGYSKYKVIGFGFQVAFSITIFGRTVSGGFEVILFNFRRITKTCVYFFISGDLDYYNYKQYAKTAITKKFSKIALKPKDILNKNSFSVYFSFMLILGNSDFVLNNYTGKFTTYSATIKVKKANVKGFYSKGTNCKAIGVGAGGCLGGHLVKFNLTYSKSYYWYVNLDAQPFKSIINGYKYMASDIKY